MSLNRILVMMACGMALQALPVMAGPIEALLPGEWYEAPNSRMDALDPCPTDNCVYSGASGQSDVVNAWNGGAYDTIRDRLILWGGGHAGYAGNEFYFFDINTLAWSRTNPSTQPVNNADPYPDGTANPRHTYGTSLYIPTLDRFWVAGGSIWQDGGCGAKVWMYNFNASPPKDGWEPQVSSYQSEGMGDCGGLAAYDAAKDRVLLLAKLGYNLPKLFAFDMNNLSAPWSVLQNDTSRLLYQTAVVDPKRRKFVVVGAGGTWTYDIDQAGAPRTQLSTSGATSIESANAPGVAYDPVSDRIVAWAGGQTVYTLDMDEYVWEARTPTNSVNPGSVTASGGTWGRFQYIPSKNAYVVVNSVSKNVYIYKLSSGTGTSPPQRPGKPTVTVR